MDGDLFANALSGFIARGRNPEMILSDNGTNFAGGEKEIKEAMQKWNDSHKTQNHFLVNIIKWLFNPPKVSQMGCVWEGQIRTVRKLRLETPL